MRMVTASGRSRWPIIIGATVLVVAISGGIAYTATRPTPTPNAAPSTATATPTPTPTSSTGATGIGDDVAPTGCLGGQDRNVNMVLAAQADAKQTTYGAVEVATAFERWFWQYPYPVAAESDAISSKVMATTANAAWKDVTAQYAGAGADPTQGVVEPGTSFHVSTTNGLWRVTEDSTADRVTVELAVGYVVNGELSPTKVAGMGLVMVWEDGGWHVETGTVVDETKLSNGGNRYTGGC